MSTSVTSRSRRASGLSRAVSIWGLLVLLVVLIVLFSALKPGHFSNLLQHSLDHQQQVDQALLALAVFVPMAATHFDLSVGFLLGISQVLVIGLQGEGLGWVEAVGGGAAARRRPSGLPTACS